MNRRQFLQTTDFAAAALPVAPVAFAAKPSIICVERDGMLDVRREREFILGLYQVPKQDGALRERVEPFSARVWRLER